MFTSRRPPVRKLVEKEDWETLRGYDELSREVEEARVLCDWTPLPCNFAPTFKVERDQTIEKYNPKRLPSYTDRMLVRSMPGFKDNLAHAEFTSCPEFTSSDHKPIRGLFEINPTPPARSGGAFGKRLKLKFSRISAHGLPVMDFGGKADPYIVFSTDPKNILMKVKGKAAKSTTKKQTLNPTWEEEIVLHLKVQSEQVS